jgi:PKD repeat protein
MDWIYYNEPVAGFDFNGDGKIDFNDTVWLFNQI